MLRRTFLKSSITSVAAFTLANMLAGPLAAANEDAKNYQKALALLRASLQGTLLLPADPGYLKCAYSANTRFNSVLPLAIALCESASDVSICIRWSQKIGVPLAPKGGGHN